MFKIQNLILLLFLLITASVFANSGYQVGYEKMEVFSEAADEPLSIALVYPTDMASKNVRFGPFELKISIGAPFAKAGTGKFPLVIISHGSGGSNLGHRSIAFALVKKGFVVAMPLHTNNNYKNNSAEGTVDNWINRPKQIKETIDSILSNTKYSEYVDENKVAIIGHSAGGYTALAVAGAKGNTTHLFELCKNHAKEHQTFCGLGADVPNYLGAKKIEGQGDKRVKSLVLMAPVGVLFKSEDALERLDVPILLYRAEKDTQLIEPYHSELIVKNYPHKEKLIYKSVKNAGHYSFITPFPKSIRESLGDIARDPEGFDREAFHKNLNEEISIFLERTLQ